MPGRGSAALGGRRDHHAAGGRRVGPGSRITRAGGAPPCGCGLPRANVQAAWSCFCPLPGYTIGGSGEPIGLMQIVRVGEPTTGWVMDTASRFPVLGPPGQDELDAVRLLERAADRAGHIPLICREYGYEEPAAGPLYPSAAAAATTTATSPACPSACVIHRSTLESRQATTTSPPSSRPSGGPTCQQG